MGGTTLTLLPLSKVRASPQLCPSLVPVSTHGRPCPLKVSCSGPWEECVMRAHRRIALARAQAEKRSALAKWHHRNGILKSARAAEAMKQIDRAEFCLDKRQAYEDSPQPIGFNATISAPHMHAYCLSLLDGHLQPGMKVLDVGSGSGYLTAVMALMVGEGGRAVGVEHIPELVERSLRAVERSKAAHLLEGGQLSILVADGRMGYPEGGPYDAIHVGAAAPELPKELVKQLKPGGRLVCPVGSVFQELEVIDKKLDGSIARQSEMGVRYVPLTARDRQLAPF